MTAFTGPPGLGVPRVGAQRPAAQRMAVRRPGDAWLDREAGPVVRPYAMTSGRTRPSRGAFDLISIIRATGRPSVGGTDLGPEAVQIIQLCQIPLSVAEIAAHLDLPAGTVKVLLGDLLEQELIRSRNPMPGAEAPTEPVLEAVMHALRSL